MDPDPGGPEICGSGTLLLSLYLEATIRIHTKEKGRIRIRIKVTNRIRIPIKVTSRIRFPIKVTSMIWIRIPIKVMRIRSTVVTFKFLSMDKFPVNN
jgi:hypothetical protein